MEKISRRRLIQVVVAAVVICAAIFLFRSMGGNNTEKLLLGDWYMEGDSRVFFTLYDNGTSKIRYDYGLGKWSVVNNDRLTISGFYGDTMTFKIVKISKNAMEVREIDYNGQESEETGTFWRTAEDAMKH